MEEREELEIEGKYGVNAPNVKKNIQIEKKEYSDE